ncbi:signal peptide peptidase SppA [bacterium]|nr:signal peptide peptidase SppA [bacterium]
MSIGHDHENQQPQIIVQMPPQPSFLRTWTTRLLFSFLLLSVFMNFALLTSEAELHTGPLKEHISGNEQAKDSIAVIELSGTIMPPFTERIIELIDAARDDDDIKGVVLSIDSPGGLVADSHQIYHRLKLLSDKKPIYVSMKRMAASGGVYVAMGAGEKGKIFAEPTTWTGSIGVIIPRYDLTGLAEKFGVQSDSLTTGPFKDSLNPFKPLDADERVVWGAIMDDAFKRFVDIVAEGRKDLDADTVRTKLATGQIFTANQAVENGLIDEIAFQEQVVEILQADLGLSDVNVFKYKRQPTLLDVLIGTAAAKDPETLWQKALEATVPRAMYYCSWLPAL